MKKRFLKIRALIAGIAPSMFEGLMAINRVIPVAYCNLTLAFFAVIVEKGSDHIKKFSRSIVIIALLSIIAIAGWNCNAYAYETQQEPPHAISDEHQGTLSCG